MAKDVLITPANATVQFFNTSGTLSGTIDLDAQDTLRLFTPSGGVTIGDTTSNVYIGDGTDVVDVIFEQNGAIRALTGKTITLGQSDSYLKAAAPLTFASPDGTKLITASMYNTGNLSFSGSAGELLSLNDTSEGVIYSVNDVSGIPSIEVRDTGEIRFAEYSGNVLFGTNTDSGCKVTVSGSVKASSYSNDRVDLGSRSSSTDIDVMLSNYFTATATGNFAFTFSNALSGTVMQIFVIELTNGGDYTITWPNSVKWPADTAPTLTSGGTDLLIFVTDNNGTTWRGSSQLAYTT